MKSLLPGLALALSAAWGCGGGGMEIPTVELGGAGGARLMNGTARTPSEAYDNAYSQLTRAHYNVRRNLDSRSQNQYGARESMKQIIVCVETMRSCVPPADQPRFDPYLSRYAGWVKELDNGTWGGSFLTDFDRAEREVKSKFNPSGMEVLIEFPNAPAPEKKPGPASRRPADKPETVLAPDQVEVLPTRNPPPAEVAKPRPAEPPANAAASQRLLFRAWSAAHNDLIAAYKEKKVCKPKYDEVVESLRLLKAQLAGEKATKLQIYIDYYGGVDEKTQNCTTLPEKTAEKDIVDELDVAARVIRKEFNPDK
jgi:hypothetical protein